MCKDKQQYSFDIDSSICCSLFIFVSLHLSLVFECILTSVLCPQLNTSSGSCPFQVLRSKCHLLRIGCDILFSYIFFMTIWELN